MKNELLLVLHKMTVRVLSTDVQCSQTDGFLPEKDPEEFIMEPEATQLSNLMCPNWLHHRLSGPQLLCG